MSNQERIHQLKLLILIQAELSEKFHDDEGLQRIILHCIEEYTNEIEQLEKQNILQTFH